MSEDVAVSTGQSLVIEIDDGGAVQIVESAPVTELVILTPGMQGPAGPAGAPGPPGETGPPGTPGAGAERSYGFALPLLVWEVTHDIPITPNVITKDGSGRVIEGDVSYPTPATVRVEWAIPMAGTLILTS